MADKEKKKKVEGSKKTASRVFDGASVNKSFTTAHLADKIKKPKPGDKK